jgi:hypothetical protein
MQEAAHGMVTLCQQQSERYADRGMLHTAEYSPICRYASTRERKAHINHSGVGFGPHPAL